jgi:hypothetical protein
VGVTGGVGVTVALPEPDVFEAVEEFVVALAVLFVVLFAGLVVFVELVVLGLTVLLVVD